MNNESIEQTLNRPEHVANASHKLKTLQRLKSAEIPTVPFTTDKEEALDWGEVIYVRHKLTGHSGEGIEVHSNFEMPLPDAPLYTKGIANYGEYRVHVFKGEVIDYRKKCRKNGDIAAIIQKLVRTHDNGWIYRRDIKRIDRVMELAIETIETLGLDFGAVDIIKNEDDEIMVLEVNTAVGLEGSTLENYITAILKEANKDNA
jgi:glutathione synthase/RimK-type ligase-like ATP-grasp enzyme